MEAEAAVSPITIELLIAGATFVLSVSVSMFITGAKWGEMRGDIRSIADRLAKIEGMFTLTLRQRDRDELDKLDPAHRGSCPGRPVSTVVADLHRRPSVAVRVERGH
jgi:hypothetical protein